MSDSRIATPVIAGLAMADLMITGTPIVAQILGASHELSRFVVETLAAALTATLFYPKRRHAVNLSFITRLK
jgi:hypothetical protein